MKPELDAKLCAEFPSIFRERGLPATESCMHWGIDVGDGWYDLIHDACELFMGVIRNEEEDVIRAHKTQHQIAYEVALSPEILKTLHIGEMTVVAEQVKEKYGYLRLYWYSENLSEKARAEVDGIVAMAELISVRTCEKCGHPGEMRGPGWLSVRCEACGEGKTTMEEYNKWVDAMEKDGNEMTGTAWAAYLATKAEVHK